MGRAIEDGDFTWSCTRCCRGFEVRTVFLSRSSSVDAKAFAHKVRAEMARQSLTQATVGRLIGVTGAYISTILSGRRTVSVELARRIERALRIDLEL